mmetsp:Transcript_13167/g.22314  ORF Transcript_13167/g.22314 Transcript_13167/m.22314 type:complete len:89 (+) Transcript_13167:331-597(+)
MGAPGRYQFRILAIQVALMSLGSYVLYPMAFYELQPVYECSKLDKETDTWSEWYECSRFDFCGNLQPAPTNLADLPIFRVNEKSPYSL